VRAPANMEEAKEVAEWREARRKSWPSSANLARKVGGGCGVLWKGGAQSKPPLAGAL